METQEICIIKEVDKIKINRAKIDLAKYDTSDSRFVTLMKFIEDKRNIITKEIESEFKDLEKERQAFDLIDPYYGKSIPEDILIEYQKIVNQGFKKDNEHVYVNAQKVSGINEAYEFNRIEIIRIQSIKEALINCYGHYEAETNPSFIRIADYEKYVKGKPEYTKSEKEIQIQSKPDLPSELNTEEAKRIFSKAKELGLMTDEYKWSGTKYQLAYFAEIAAEKLNLKHKWKPFQKLFNKKDLAQTRRESKERFGTVNRADEIDHIFS